MALRDMCYKQVLQIKADELGSQAALAGPLRPGWGGRAAAGARRGRC